MLAIAVIVPDTALLVPGSAGRADVLQEARAAAVDAVRAALVLAPDGPDRVVVVAAGLGDRIEAGPVQPSLTAAGIDVAALGWSAGAQVAGAGAAGPVVGVAASVALLLLGHVGWSGPVTVVEVAPPDQRDGDGAGRASALHAMGSELVGGPDRLALIVAGSLSARHGAGAPVSQDDRAASFDSAILADLRAGDERARRRLGAVSGALAAELVVTAWAPLQVLCGAAAQSSSIEAEVRWSGAPFGVAYPIAVWRERGEAR